ncbi:MAG: chromosome segregation protein SMC, partial [Candidatus Dadabacteria bacterium]
AQAEQSRVEDERRQLEDRRAEAAAKLAGCRESLEELRVEEVQLRQRRETVHQRLQELRLTIDELDGRRDALARQIEECEAERAAVRDRLAAPDLELESRRRELAEAERAVECLAAEEQAAGGWVRSVEGRLRTLRRDLEELRERRGAAEVRAKQLELEYRSIADAARERLGGDPEEVAAGDATEADPELEQELQRVRNAIRRIGTVNLGAVEELEEIEGRLAELVAQRDDLEKSIEDLRGTIARLNRLSKRRFRETFDAVNELFKKTFPHMFHGGQAWLALTDESNLLETGVEIFVRPPGKRVANLNLLSGGEKALTAVSLIFSLFLYKPSPFCILDEVDAPLDDANIGRFSRMIREMSDRSQFVLITHNKRTMEACDVLYGVTMGEPGVSKVVSVELPSS